MFLRVVAKTVARRLPHQVNRTVLLASVGAAAGPKNVRWASGDAKKEALDEYRSVVADLLTGVGDTATDMASVETLLEWNKEKLETLTLDQLEELGRAWFEGVDDDFPKDLTRAFEVWSVAAKMGSAESGYSRAVMMREGTGVPQDSAAAFQALSEVANSKNYAMAHFAAAIMLAAGEGVAQDHERAFHHYWQASLGGIIPAIHNIANAYALGQGVAQSDAKAAHFYETAAHCGDPAAKFTLGTWLYKGKGMPEDKKRAFQLQFEAAQTGHAVAMFNTGSAYLEGTVVDTNYKEAAGWFEKAASLGFPEAAVNLGMLYRRGTGGEGPSAVPKDLNKALEVFKKFAHVPMVVELIQDVEEEIRSSQPP